MPFGISVHRTKKGPGRAATRTTARPSGTKLLRGAINKTLTIRTSFRNVHATPEQQERCIYF